MGNIVPLIMRFIAIGIGYMLGALASGLAYVFLTGLIRPGDFGTVNPAELTVTLIVGTLGVSAIMARAALLPALIVIAIYEIFRRRDWLAHVLAGAFLAGALGVMTYADGDGSKLAIYMVCGALGASVYWLIAGRGAGRWFPSERRALRDQHVEKFGTQGPNA